MVSLGDEVQPAQVRDQVRLDADGKVVYALVHEHVVIQVPDQCAQVPFGYSFECSHFVRSRDLKMVEVGVYNAPLAGGGRFTPLILFLAMLFGTGNDPTHPSKIADARWKAMADYHAELNRIRVVEYTGG